MRSRDAPETWWVTAGLVALLSSAWIAAHTSGFVDVSLDADAIRVLGGGWTGPFGYPSALVRGAFKAVPFGPVAMRITLANAALSFAFAIVLFRAVMRMTRHVPSEGMRQACATVVTLAVSTLPTYVYSASSIGPGLFIATLALLAISLRHERWDARRGFLLGLALAEGPAAFALVLSTHFVNPPADDADDARGRERRKRDRGLEFIRAMGMGALPIAVGFVRNVRHGALSLSESMGVAWPSDYGVRLRALLRDDVGVFLLIATAISSVVLLWTEKGAMRRSVSRLVVLFAASLVLSPFRVADGVADGAAIVALAIAHVLSGVLAASVLTMIRGASLPLAKTSAVMVLLLLGSLPVNNIDEVVRRPPALTREARLLFDHFLVGSFSPFPIVLATNVDDEIRLRGMQSAGTMRPDAHVVTVTRPEAITAQRESAREPGLIPIFRDVVISRAPEALSLSELARDRAVYLLDPEGVGKGGARQLVPAGLAYEFYPEPRGRADRQLGLSTLARERPRLASLRGASGLAPELTRRLRSRALAMGNADDIEMLSSSLEDLRSMQSDDPWLVELPKRMVLGRGHVDMTGLDPRR